jgi:hypothetical protein
MNVTMNELDGISRLLGEIEGTLRALDRRVEANDQRSTEHRRVMHERFDDQDQAIQTIVKEAADTASAVRYMRKTIDEDLKPVTDDVKRWRLMGMGALAVTGLGAASIGGTIIWVLQSIWPHAR